MINKHKLLQKKHDYFLNQNRQDPITGDIIQENDTVVICAACKSAFLEGSWGYMNSQHCNQSLTLKEIPKKQFLFLGQKKDTANKNDNYRSISILTIIITTMALYCMLIYHVDSHPTLSSSTSHDILLGGAFLTGGICGILILFIDAIFKDKLD